MGLFCILNAFGARAQTVTELDIEIVFGNQGAFSEGYIIAAPRFSSVQTYPLVLDHLGNILHNELNAFRGFNFDHHPDGRLAWYSTDGGQWEVLDSSLQAAALIDFYGAEPDYHDLELRPDGSALLLGEEITVANLLDSVPDPSDPFRAVIDCLIQEQDSAGNVTWFWRASDHIPPTWCTHCNWNASLLDAYHHNAFQTLDDGDILLCLRNMDAVVRIDRQTGGVDWVLGGPFSDFTFTSSDGAFSHPHDAQMLDGGRLILFDNGTGKDPEVSRAAEYMLDEEAGLVTLVDQWIHPEQAYASSQGSVQKLDGGGMLIGWGTGASSAFFGGMVTEYDEAGNLLGTVYFPANHFTYRARKVPPGQLPLIQGCRDPEACNFDAGAVLEGACILEGTPCDDGNPCTVVDVFGADCQCTGMLPPADAPIGCSDPEAVNFDTCAYPDTDDGSCQYAVSFRVDATTQDVLPQAMQLLIDGNALDLEPGGFGTWVGSLVLGNDTWTFQFAADGVAEPVMRTLSLTWPLDGPLEEQRACFGSAGAACPGCTDPDDPSYSPFAVDDSRCGAGPWVGCTTPQASNYSPMAMFDDGTCQYGALDDCPQDMDGNGIVGIADILIVLTYFGVACN